MRQFKVNKMTERTAIDLPTIERDLKALLQSEERFAWKAIDKQPDSDVSLDQAVQLFDRLRKKESKSAREMVWSNPSVVGLSDPDPISAIVRLARRKVLGAIESGWS